LDLDPNHTPQFSNFNLNPHKSATAETSISFANASVNAALQYTRSPLTKTRFTAVSNASSAFSQSRFINILPLASLDRSVVTALPSPRRANSSAFAHASIAGAFAANPSNTLGRAASKLKGSTRSEDKATRFTATTNPPDAPRVVVVVVVIPHGARESSDFLSIASSVHTDERIVARHAVSGRRCA
jgi:hypothetical protein